MRTVILWEFGYVEIFQRISIKSGVRLLDTSTQNTLPIFFADEQMNVIMLRTIGKQKLIYTHLS